MNEQEPQGHVFENLIPVIQSESENPQTSSSSARKLCQQDEYLSTKQESSSDSGFILIDVGLLFNFLSSRVSCDECSNYSLSCELSEKSRSGFSHEITLSCTNYQEWSTKLTTSEEGQASGHKKVNLRMVAFVRSLGRGHAALQNFSLYLNSPGPMTANNYSKMFSKIHSASKEVAKDSMNAAADELRRMHPTSDNHNANNNSNGNLTVTDCAISVDGTWQRRGHVSHHGVVTAISIDTGKCIDTEVLSNICKGCQHWQKRKGTQEYESWRLTHSCKANHTGSAGAMEAVGAVRIFSRSQDMRQLRYTQYLGDGDSASFKKVLDSKPYGEDVNIEKLECVGHVQKRCGTRLRRLVQENKGKKLNDGKSIGGIGRLTAKKIDTLQNYYGFSIRQNAGNLDQMAADVRAVLHHVGSSEKKPMHDFCPANSWCKYKVDPQNYKHRNGLPDAVIGLIEPIFNDLASTQLLRKCLHGKTQNNNECLNKLIWDRCSKEYYVEVRTVEEAVYSAISYFNDGASSIAKLLEKLGIVIGHNSLQKCKTKDTTRINASDNRSSTAARKRRKTLKAIRKGFMDTTEATEGDMYTAGGH